MPNVMSTTLRRVNRLLGWPIIWRRVLTWWFFEKSVFGRSCSCLIIPVASKRFRLFQNGPANGIATDHSFQLEIMINATVSVAIKSVYHVKWAEPSKNRRFLPGTNISLKANKHGHPQVNVVEATIHAHLAAHAS